MLGYVLRSLRRNPKRALAAVAGVALAFALFADAAFFVDGSGRQMTRRAVAHVTIDMQAGVNESGASPLALVTSVTPRPPLAAGQEVTVTLAATNTGSLPATAVVVEAPLPPQLTYLFNSTHRDGAMAADVVAPVEPPSDIPVEEGGPPPPPPVPPAPPLEGGFGVGTLAPGASTTITYRATTKVAVASAADLLGGAVRSAEEPAPARANGPTAVDLRNLATALEKEPELEAVQPFGLIELPAGSVTSGATVLGVPVKLVAIDPDYPDDIALVRFPAGEFLPGTAFLSPSVSQRLGAAVGAPVRVRIPGTPETSAVSLPVSAIADLTGADQWFASRIEDSLGDFVSAPDVIGVDIATFQQHVLPALRVDSSAPVPAVVAAPVLEVHAQVARGLLSENPRAARGTTTGVRRTIERAAPGELTVIDNLTGGLDRARRDSILATVLFMALGLPGALLAGYLAFYGAGLLAESERRERALLRARGFGPATLTRAVAYQAAGIAVIGSALGAALALAVAGALFPADVEVGDRTVALAVGALVALVTTLLAIYRPAKRALLRDVTESRQAVMATERPGWLRIRLDLMLLLVAALVSAAFVLTGGFAPKASAHEENIALSFYLLLAPWCLWLGATLLVARGFFAVSRRLGRRTTTDFRRHLVSRTLRRSVARRPGIVAAGMITVSLAVAFGVSLAVFVATFHDRQAVDARFAVGSDVRVTVGIGQTLPADIESRLRVPGVVAVSPVGQVPDTVLGSEKLQFAAVDPGTFPAVAPLSSGFFTDTTAEDAMQALADDPTAVLVDSETADSFNLDEGDVVRLLIPSPALGQSVLVEFKVAGTLTQFPGFPTGLDFVGNLGAYRQATGVASPSYYLLRTDGTEATNARVVAALGTALGPDVPTRITTTAAAANPDQTSIAGLSLTGLGRVEGFYMLVIASLGIIIFVATLLVQRTGERAVMRALGLARRRLRAVLLGEAVLVATVSTVAGTLIGVPMAYMFIQILRRIFVVPPAALSYPDSLPLLLVGVAAVTIAVAAVIVSLAVRRLHLVEYLRSE
jgi:putative ABC transport system permease protein